MIDLKRDVENCELSFAFVLMMYLRQSVSHLTAFEEAVKKCPNVLVCYLMSGTSDYLLRVAARDLADYERIHKEWLSAMPGVARMTSSFALREVINRASVDIRINDGVPTRPM